MTLNDPMNFAQEREQKMFGLYLRTFMLVELNSEMKLICDLVFVRRISKLLLDEIEATLKSDESQRCTNCIEEVRFNLIETFILCFEPIIQ